MVMAALGHTFQSVMAALGRTPQSVMAGPVPAAHDVLAIDSRILEYPLGGWTIGLKPLSVCICVHLWFHTVIATNGLARHFLATTDANG